MEDVLGAEILPRLPVKSLLRFKSVAKSWKFLISSVEFAKLHLQKSRHPTCCSSNVILGDTFEPNKFTLKIVEVENTKREEDKPNIDIVLSVLDSKDGESCIGYYNKVGTCNGLICYSDRYSNSLCVWNPATRKKHHIEAPTPKFFATVSLSGFGYDSTCDGYKVLLLGAPHEKPVRNFVWLTKICYLYSSRTHEWKLLDISNWLQSVLDQVGNSSFYFRGSALVNETLHWALSYYNPNEERRCWAIWAFNLATESFSIVPLPNPIIYNNMINTRQSRLLLYKIKECLCAYWMWPEIKSTVVEVWMLKHYGEWESWTKLFNLTINHEKYYAPLYPHIFMLTDHSGKPVTCLLAPEFDQLLCVQNHLLTPKFGELICVHHHLLGDHWHPPTQVIRLGGDHAYNYGFVECEFSYDETLLSPFL